ALRLRRPARRTRARRPRRSGHGPQRRKRGGMARVWSVGVCWSVNDLTQVGCRRRGFGMTATDGRLAAEVVIVGGGPAGLAAAIALAGYEVETALVAGRAHPSDNRTTALLTGSVTALAMLGVWDKCREQAAPLRVI